MMASVSVAKLLAGPGSKQNVRNAPHVRHAISLYSVPVFCHYFIDRLQETIEKYNAAY